MHTKAVLRGLICSFSHLKIVRFHLEPQLRPALAHVQKRGPERPGFGEEVERNDRAHAPRLARIRRLRRPAESPG